MIEYLRLCWHRWILRHWQIPRQNGAEPAAVICECGITWEDKDAGGQSPNRY